MADLNILNDFGRVVGTARRAEIHAKGLLHGEVHVWAYTPRGEVIFQRRAITKDTYPGLLDASVGGHVEAGQSFDDAAQREVAEEMGLAVSAHQLRLLSYTNTRSVDANTGTINHALRAVYAYRFTGLLSDLAVESGEGAGFEAWTLNALLALSEIDKRRFVPFVFEPTALERYAQLASTVRDALP